MTCSILLIGWNYGIQTGEQILQRIFFTNKCSTNESTQIITGHVIFKLRLLKTNKDFFPFMILFWVLVTSILVCCIFCCLQSVGNLSKWGVGGCTLGLLNPISFRISNPILNSSSPRDRRGPKRGNIAWTFWSDMLLFNQTWKKF